MAGGSLQHLTYANTTIDGTWSCTVSGVPDGAYICALATADGPIPQSSPKIAVFPILPRRLPPRRYLPPTHTATPVATPTLTPIAFADLHGKTAIAYPNPGQDKIQFLMNFSQDTSVKIMTIHTKKRTYGDSEPH